jgi:hypothetical protein
VSSKTLLLDSGTTNLDTVGGGPHSGSVSNNNDNNKSFSPRGNGGSGNAGVDDGGNNDGDDVGFETFKETHLKADGEVGPGVGIEEFRRAMSLTVVELDWAMSSREFDWNFTRIS